MRAQSLSHVQLFVDPRTIAHQAPLPMEFSSQKYWSGVPFSFLGNLPTQEQDLNLLRPQHLKAGALSLVRAGKPSSVYSRINVSNHEIWEKLFFKKQVNYRWKMPDFLANK